MITATILAASPRAAVFKQVFGTRTVRVQSKEPVMGIGPNGVSFYLYADVSALSDAQWGRVVEYMHRTLHRSREALAHDLAQPGAGLPINFADLFVEETPD